MKFLFTIWFLANLIITSATNAAEVFVYPDNHIRALAASCAACHGSNGNSTGITPTLAGLDIGYFTSQMQAFKDGGRPATVMHHHAKGLNTDEINQLAIYFFQQKRVSSAPPTPQTLKARHAD